MKSRLIGCQNESIIMFDLIKNVMLLTHFAVENDSASLQCMSGNFSSRITSGMRK